MIRAMITALAMVCTLAVTFRAAAQPPPPTPSPAVQQSLKVQVVLSRYQGEKKISSLPYTLTVTTNAPMTSLRMGAEVPVATTVFQGAEGKAPVSSYNYRSIGTSIDCSAVALDGGRYSVRLLIEDSSIYPDDSATGADKIGTHPRFRSFKSDESLVLSDGQSAQNTTATDKVTGEIMKVDVTMSVLR